MQTRKVNTYGRRSIAILPAGFGRPLLTPPRAGEQSSPPLDSPLSEISADIIVESPSLSRSSPVAMKRSKKVVLSNNLPKKENLVADMSGLSIASPPVTRPRKRKPLLVPSPKVRGSPKQSRIDKKLRSLPALANKTSSPLRRAPLQHASNVVDKHPKREVQHSIIEISDDESYPIPKKHPPTHQVKPQVAQPTFKSKLTAQAPSESVIVLTDSSCDLGAQTAASSWHPPTTRPPLQPLTRQNAVVGTPPLLHRLNTGARLSGGSVSRLSFGSVVNASSPRPPTSPVPMDGDLPSPVDSDDEMAFLDVAAELESKPAPPTTHARSEFGPRARPPPPQSSGQGSKALGAPSLANGKPKAKKPVASTSRLKPPPASTKSLPLVPTKSRPSIVYVELPAPRKASQTKPDSVEQPPAAQPSSSRTAQPPPIQPSKPPKASKPAKPVDSNRKAGPSTSSTKPSSPTEPGPSEPKSAPPAAKTRPRPKPKPRPRSESPPLSPHSRQLRSLLETCSQPEPIDLEAFVATFSTDDVHTRYPAPSTSSGSRRRWRKIGEASYSEVFGLGGVVVKVVPLKMEDGQGNGWGDKEGPCVSEMADVEKEIAVTRAMGEIQEGFIKLVRAHVARGPYPQELLTLWDTWDREFGSESIRPDSFLPSQLYVLLILPDGGPDLEHYTFTPRTSWRAAAGIFWQVARTLARAEALVRFEHRDLHWGQILVQNVSTGGKTTLKGSKAESKSKSKSKSKSHSNAMDSPEQSGVRVTLIDLGLSRMDTHTRKAWFTELEPEIFEGEGDYQFDLYRMMKAHCSNTQAGEGIWEGFRPLTNVMWLHYLARQLLRAKGLRKPETIPSRYHTADDIQSEIQACSCLIDIEKVLAAAIIKAGGPAVSKAGGSVLTKTAKGASISGVQKLVDAQSVVRWGAERRWVHAACGSVDEGGGAL